MLHPTESHPLHWSLRRIHRIDLDYLTEPVFLVSVFRVGEVETPVEQMPSVATTGFAETRALLRQRRNPAVIEIGGSEIAVEVFVAG